MFDRLPDSVGFIGLIFAAIFLAGSVLYFISTRSVRLSDYIALHSDISGFDAAGVHLGLVRKLVHEVRAGKMKPHADFDVSAFLRARNMTYLRGCNIAFLICFVPSAFFIFRDILAMAA